MLQLDYSSSDSEADAVVRAPERRRSPTPKRRKLPSLSATFGDDDPQENSAHYQGRVLSRSRVQGDYPTHIYLAFPISPSCKALVTRAKELLPPLHSLVHPPTSSLERAEMRKRSSAAIEDDEDDDDATLELHVSLSKPLYLRFSQKAAIESELRKVAEGHARFLVSLSRLTTFNNDDKTRTFLSIDVGAGFSELVALTDSINSTLSTHHLPTYYSPPLFHVSVAWGPLHAAKAAKDEGKVAFPTLSEIPESVVAQLEREFGPTVRKESCDEAIQIRMKCGGRVERFPLGAHGLSGR